MSDPFLEIGPVRTEQDAMKESIGSAVKVRNGTVVYRKGADEKNKANFRSKWAGLIRRESQLYVRPAQPISDIQHCDAIRRISDDQSNSFRELLRDGELRNGISQKAFNLYLKYLWRLGKAVLPPHCPVDGVVLRAGAILGSWTDNNSEKEYMDWINRLRAKASNQGLSLSEWEYRVWLDDYLQRGSSKCS